MNLRQCKRCGGHAVAVQGHDTRPVCMDCVDHDGPPHRYVCTVAGCGNQPIYLVVLENHETASALMCGRHFPEVKDRIVSYLDLPPWLTHGNDFHPGDGGVVFEFEVNSDQG